MRKLAVLIAFLSVLGFGVGGFVAAQDEPATPPTYAVPCASPAAQAIASPDTLTDPAAEAKVAQQKELAEMNATPGATPGVFVCATPGASPAA